MGIQGLLPFLDSGKDEINLSTLKGKVVGVDAHVWLYKGAYCCAWAESKDLLNWEYELFSCLMDFHQ